MYTYRCTKVFSPRKACGDIDLIWLFSMNLDKKKILSECTRKRTIHIFNQWPPGWIYLQILQMRKTKERVLIYGFQVVGCKEAVQRDLRLISFTRHK